jgi:hypothetical protein
MNKNAYALACFKVTQRLLLEGKIPPSESCEHACARGDALAKLGLAIASEQRMRKWAFGTPQHKAAQTRTVKRINELAHSSRLGRHFNLSYIHNGHPINWPVAAFACGTPEWCVFDIPNPDNF